MSHVDLKITVLIRTDISDEEKSSHFYWYKDNITAKMATTLETCLMLGTTVGITEIRSPKGKLQGWDFIIPFNSRFNPIAKKIFDKYFQHDSSIDQWFVFEADVVTTKQ